MSRVEHVCASQDHTLRKFVQRSVRLVVDSGVEGDAHAGRTVKHRSRVRRDPTQPNLRQVHLMQAELHDELAGRDMPIEPGQMGENITTRGIDLLALPRDTILRFEGGAAVRVTGLRNPCDQLESIHVGLREAVLDRSESGELVRKAGIMSVVVASGVIQPGTEIQAELPAEPHVRLERV